MIPTSAARMSTDNVVVERPRWTERGEVEEGAVAERERERERERVRDREGERERGRERGG